MVATKNRAKGRAKQVKGKAKETAGRATGNDRMKASGLADRAEGKAQSVLADAGEKVKRLTRKIAGKD